MIDQPLPAAISPFVFALQKHRSCTLLISDAQACANGGPRLVAASWCCQAVIGGSALELHGAALTSLLRGADSAVWRAVDNGHAHRSHVRARTNGTEERELTLELIPIYSDDDSAAATHFAWLLQWNALECRGATLNPEALLFFDHAGTIRYATPHTEELLGAQPYELFGQSLAATFAASESDQVKRLLQFGRDRSNNKHDHAAAKGPIRMRHKVDQRSRTLEFDLLRYGADPHAPNSDAIVALVRDVTAHKTHRRGGEIERPPLTVALSKSSDTEKAVVGRELHDGLGQTITGAAFLAKSVADRLHSEAHPLVERAARVSSLLVDAIKSVRSLTVLFSPQLDRTLTEALEHLAEWVSGRAGVHCEVDVCDEALGLPEAVRSQLYWIAQEAIMNAVRHANATRIRVTYRTDPPCLRVEDNGKGLCATAATGRGPVGLGLRIMQCRAEQIGYKIELICPPQAGTHVICSVAPTTSQRIPRQKGGPSGSSDTTTTTTTTPKSPDATASSSHEVAACSTDSSDQLA